MLRPGDVFLTRNPMAIGRAINAVQTFWSDDDESTYSHAGVITSDDGKTFEALWTLGPSDMKEYVGKDVLIMRFSKMSPLRFKCGMKQIERYRGKWYPFYRLAFMAIKPLAKYVFLGIPVCSELTGKFLLGAGVDIHWKGLSPDGLHDFLKNHRNFYTVFKGTWEE